MNFGRGRQQLESQLIGAVLYACDVSTPQVAVRPSSHEVGVYADSRAAQQPHDPLVYRRRPDPVEHFEDGFPEPANSAPPGLEVVENEVGRFVRQREPELVG
jgi:hypothetical protein